MQNLHCLLGLVLSTFPCVDHFKVSYLTLEKPLSAKGTKFNQIIERMVTQNLYFIWFTAFHEELKIVTQAMIVCDMFVSNIPKDNLSFPRISGQCSLAQRASESLPRNKTTGPFAPFTLVRLDISALCQIQKWPFTAHRAVVRSVSSYQCECSQNVARI